MQWAGLCCVQPHINTTHHTDHTVGTSMASVVARKPIIPAGAQTGRDHPYGTHWLSVVGCFPRACSHIHTMSPSTHLVPVCAGWLSTDTVQPLVVSPDHTGCLIRCVIAAANVTSYDIITGTHVWQGGNSAPMAPYNPISSHGQMATTVMDHHSHFRECVCVCVCVCSLCPVPPLSVQPLPAGGQHALHTLTLLTEKLPTSPETTQ